MLLSKTVSDKSLIQYKIDQNWGKFSYKEATGWILSSHPEWTLIGKCCKHRVTNRRLQSNKINKFINDHFNTRVSKDALIVSQCLACQTVATPLPPSSYGATLQSSHAQTEAGPLSSPPLCRRLCDCMHIFSVNQVRGHPLSPTRRSRFSVLPGGQLL